MTPATRRRIKRALGPVLPIVLPVKRQLVALPDRRPIRAALVTAGRVWFGAGDTVRRMAGRPRPPIRALRKFEFDELVLRAPYYRPRWSYMSAAGRIADRLIAAHRLRSALELGPHLRPLIVGADVMDRLTQPELEAEGRVLIHDATETPWPLEGRQYDLFVALQVFEHLGDRQAAAFAEVRRVARHALISVPIDWVMDDPSNCHHRISHEKALSWFAPIVPTRVEIGNGGPKKRMIYVFEDLPAGGPA